MKSLTLLSALLLSTSSLLWGQSSESEPVNLFSYGIGMSTEYDTDGSDSETSGGSDGEFLYSVQPKIALQVTRPRWETSLDYLSAFTYSPQSSSRDALAHSLGFTFSRQVSKRLTFDLESNFNLTTNPFDDLRVSSQSAPPDPLNGPNTSSSGEVFSRRSGHAGMEVVYALGKRSTVGVVAGFTRSDYREEVGQSYDDSRRTVTESAQLFYRRQLGPRSSTGLRYAFQKLDFGRGEFKTDSHSLLYTWDFDISPTLSLATFVGPDYSDSRNRSLEAFLSGAVQSRKLSAVGGATFGWNAKHYGVTAGAVRRVSDGGGARGNVRLDSFSIHANRQISRALGVSGFITYNRNSLLLPVAGSPDAFNYLGAGVGLDRKLTQNSLLNFFYWHVQRDDALSAGLRRGNRVGIRLVYSRQRPLGR